MVYCYLQLTPFFFSSFAVSGSTMGKISTEWDIIIITKAHRSIQQCDRPEDLCWLYGRQEIHLICLREIDEKILRSEWLGWLVTSLPLGHISVILVNRPIIASNGSSRPCWFSIGSRIFRHFFVISSSIPDAVM